MIWIILPFICSAQNYSDLRKATKRSDYVQDLSEYLNLRLSFINNAHGLKVTSGDDLVYRLVPNTKLFTKLGFHYRFLSFSVAWAPDFMPGNNDDDLKGKSKSLSFGTRMYKNRFTQELSYSKNKGFYLKNTDDFFENPDPKYSLAPELKLQEFSGRTYYQTNTNVSLKALFDQTEKQLQSAGTPIVSLIYDYYTSKNNDPNYSSHQSSRNFDLIPTVGYVQSFVINENWYIGAGASGGVGFSQMWLKTEVEDQSIKTDMTKLTFYGEVESTLGYHSTNFYAGVSLIAKGKTFNQSETSVISHDYLTMNFHIGYCFGPPEKLKKRMDDLDKIVPIEK